jgi:hypothetical protein
VHTEHDLLPTTKNPRFDLLYRRNQFFVSHHPFPPCGILHNYHRSVVSLRKFYVKSHGPETKITLGAILDFAQKLK